MSIENYGYPGGDTETKIRDIKNKDSTHGIIIAPDFLIVRAKS